MGREDEKPYPWPRSVEESIKNQLHGLYYSSFKLVSANSHCKLLITCSSYMHLAKLDSPHAPPTANVHTCCKNLKIALCSTQYQNLMHMQHTLKKIKAKKLYRYYLSKYRHHRPPEKVTVLKNPKAWWKYAVKSVILRQMELKCNW